jgi:serine/threonine-protein kinase HipA
MSLNASKGRKSAIDKIQPRHLLATAKAVKFPQDRMLEILRELAEKVPHSLQAVRASLPDDFSQKVAETISSNVLRLHARLSGSLSQDRFS